MSILNRLKKYKPVLWIFNLLHYRRLAHNSVPYKVHHFKKALTTSLSSKDFPDTQSTAWFDTGNSRILAPENQAFSGFPPSVQNQLLSWSDRGYLILSNFFDDATVARIDAEMGTLIQGRKIKPTHDNKFMFANHHSPFIRDITYTPALTNILSFILGKEVIPFQTINFMHGSNQRAHSDSIHMTTYPLGYLIAVWIALEDTTVDNGPLFYYPGSHRLPYLLNADFNSGETAFTLGKKDYRDYEDRLEEQIGKEDLIREVFLAGKGDVFIWHANLIHGGIPVVNPLLTRKSMVIHYFAKDVIKYHEITERPVLLRNF